jgi:hypothetical protein
LRNAKGQGSKKGLNGKSKETEKKGKAKQAHRTGKKIKRRLKI